MRRLYRDDESLTEEGRKFEDEIYDIIRPILKRVSENNMSVRDAGLIICGLTSCLVSDFVLEKQVSDRSSKRRAHCDGCGPKDGCVVADNCDDFSPKRNKTMLSEQTKTEINSNLTDALSFIKGLFEQGAADMTHYLATYQMTKLEEENCKAILSANTEAANRMKMLIENFLFGK